MTTASGRYLTANTSPGKLETGRGVAHGKAILLGEHSVVYGAPAIAVPLLDVRLNAQVRMGATARVDSALYEGPADEAPLEFAPVFTALRSASRLTGYPAHLAQLRIRGDIPAGRGLGSSAAVATAVVRAIADTTHTRLTVRMRYNLVQQAEAVAHGRASGLDAHAVAARGPLLVRNGFPHRLPLGSALTLVVADSGIPGSTAEAVGIVRGLRSTRPLMAHKAIENLSNFTLRSAEALTAGEMAKVGMYITSGHEILTALGVSTPKLDALVSAALTAGAFGAKLTGGGLGGCVLAIAPSVNAAEPIARAFMRAGAQKVWTTTLPASGRYPSTDTKRPRRLRSNDSLKKEAS